MSRDRRWALGYVDLAAPPPLRQVESDGAVTIRRIDEHATDGARLEHRGPDAITPLESALADPTRTRWQALSGLDDHLTPDLVPVLAPLLESPDKWTRKRALEYYARLAPPDAVQRLLNALADTDESVRWQALSGLDDLSHGDDTRG